MLKLTEIAKAWIAKANPTPEQEEIAKYRAGICDTCPSKAYSNTLKIFYCGECGCPLEAKVFSPRPGPEACPLSKWQK